MKTKKNLWVTVLSFIFILSLAVEPVTTAAQTTDKSAAKKAVVSTKTVTDQYTGEEVTGKIAAPTTAAIKTLSEIDYNFLRLYKPAMGRRIKRGNKIYTKFYIRDTWKDYYTRPVIFIYNSKGKRVYTERASSKVTVDSYMHKWLGYLQLNTKKLARGKYKFVIYAAPCYKNLSLVSGWSKWSNMVYDYNYFYIY